MSSPSFMHWGRDPKDIDIDDTAIVPAKGFLGGSVLLPTYQPKGFPIEPLSDRIWVSLTISDVLGAIHKDSHLARCVLFETARLQRPLLSMRKVKLTQDIRVVDMQLIELDNVLEQGRELIESPMDEEYANIQNLILKGETFPNTLRIAKRSLLELEKTFVDQVLSELKNGMQNKNSIDYNQIVEKVKNLNDEFTQVYSKVKDTYLEEVQALWPGED